MQNLAKCICNELRLNVNDYQTLSEREKIVYIECVISSIIVYNECQISSIIVNNESQILENPESIMSLE